MGDADVAKYIVKNVAWKHRRPATFMPEADLWRQRQRHARPPVDLEGRQTALRGQRLLAACPEMAMHYIGGILNQIAGALRRVHQPDDELVPPPGAGLRGAGELAYSSRATASAAVRIPIPSPSPKAEAHRGPLPDPTANEAIWAFSAMLMAGLDGIQKKIDPKQPLDKDISRSRRGAEGRPVDAALARDGARQSLRRTTSSCSPATSSPRTSSRPDRPDQDDPRGQRVGSAASLRVHAVPARRLIFGRAIDAGATYRR